MRRFIVLVGLFGLLGASDALAVGFDSHGTGTAQAPPPPPPVAPETDCGHGQVTLYAADYVAGNKVFRYKFSGPCMINVAPAGQPVSLKYLPTYIQGEYIPQMKRASETIITQDPDLGVNFTTWATCPSDPFVSKGVACTAQGMGSTKFDSFLNVKDIPFAHGLTNPADAKSMTPSGEPWFDSYKSGFNDPVRFHFQKLTQTLLVDQETTFFIDLIGGVTRCPMKVDFGDGTPPFIALGPHQVGIGTMTINHAYAKAGVYNAKVFGLLVCAGTENISVITVNKPFSIKISPPPPPPNPPTLRPPPKK